MVTTSLLSLVLLALAGVLLDSHRREWADAREETDPAERRFARSRTLRRWTATASIAVVGGLIALWPVTPREPWWVVVYMAALVLLAGLIFVLGVWDAWASSVRFRAESRRRVAEHTQTLVRLLEDHRGERDKPSQETESARA
ncbi:hypothetical protein Pla108_16680 [Botrimarina colliarenosi]|uniref:Uncharacterized protein n=1 Tax=Botrimarina colliarenosi TaxID=2528001 RepID=A0A5C6ANN5_9BACT|nr:hypothetical protein [Botrimarina colliarenosi]TWU00716.1 hypothetical protein Pla108_16680 [Botrimarina colliarenosi]